VKKGFILPSLFLVVLASFYFVMNTTTGLKFLLRILPGDNSAEIATGSLYRGFTLEGLQLSGNSFRLDIDRLTADWRPLSLLGGHLLLHAVNIEGVNVILNEATPGSGASPTLSFDLPVSITLESLNVAGVVITDRNAEVLFQTTQLSISAHTEDQLLLVDEINLSSPDYEAGISGQVNLTDTAEHQFSIDWLYRESADLEIAGNTIITGTMASTNISTSLTTPLQATVDLTLEEPAGDLSWSGTASIVDVSPSTYTSQFAEQLFRVELTASGSLNAAILEGEAVLTDDANMPVVGDPAYRFSNFAMNFNLDIREILTGQPEILGTSRWEVIELDLVSKGKSVVFNGGHLDLQYRDGQFQTQSGSGFSYANEETGDWSISGSGNTELIELENITLNYAGGTLNGDLTINRAATVPVYNGSASWTSLGVPGFSAIPLKLSAGTLEIAGTTEDYQLTANTDISIEDKPPLNLRMTASGDHDLTRFDSLVLTGFEGELTGTGTLDWLNGPNASLQLTGIGLNPGALWYEWPGILALDASIDAQKLADGYEVNIGDVNISGILRELPVQLALSSRFSPGLIQISNAKLSSATSSIEINGTWGMQTGIDWNIQSADLNMLHPEMTGRLNAEGSISGMPEQPVMSGVLEARKITSPWISVEQGDARLDISTVAGDNLDIDLNLKNLIWRKSTQFDEVSLIVTGHTSGHEYTLQAVSEARRLLAAGRGNYSDTQWQGSIDTLEVVPDASGATWVNVEPAKLAFQKDSVNLEQLCLQNGPASICGQFDRSTADNWQAGLHATALPVAMLNPYLPDDIDLAGQATIDIDIIKPPNDLMSGKGKLDITSGEIRMHIDAKQMESILVESFALEFDLLDGLLDSHLLAVASDRAIEPIVARLELSGLDSLQPDYSLVGIKGSLNWKQDNLSILSKAIPQITDIKGEVDVDLRLAGTVTNPQLQGKLMLGNAGFIVPELGIALENIEINGNSDRDGSYTLSGKVASGGGVLTMAAGIENVADEDYVVTARISGEGFEIINAPEIRALASPDININVTDNSIGVTGTLGISDTTINLGELRELVTLSDDVVIKDAIVQERRESSLETTVQINFGERINIQGQGLTGQLSGKLDVYTSNRGELLGKGEVAIIDGKFSAYGQSLVIEEGKLLFQGNRLNNPELRITAVRRIDETITVGLRITGYATNPLLTLFSTPALGDDEILAYIVFGRPLASLTSGEGTDLIGAATTMGLQNSGFLTRSLSSTFGLDSLQFTSDASGEHASVVIGKYLTPKLYLSYMMGVFERIATARIRYDLNKNWSVEVKSSTDVGVDLYYNIQK